MTKNIKVNQIRCKKCNNITESKHVHDFRTCKCGAVFVDGGKDYLRRGWPEGDHNDWYEELSEYE